MTHLKSAPLGGPGPESLSLSFLPCCPFTGKKHPHLCCLTPVGKGGHHPARMSPGPSLTGPQNHTNCRQLPWPCAPLGWQGAPPLPWLPLSAPQATPLPAEKPPQPFLPGPPPVPRDPAGKHPPCAPHPWAAGLQVVCRNSTYCSLHGLEVTTKDQVSCGEAVQRRQASWAKRQESPNLSSISKEVGAQSFRPLVAGVGGAFPGRPVPCHSVLPMQLRSTAPP